MSTEQIKAHNVIFDQTLHYPIPEDEIEDKKAELGEDFEFIKGFHCLEDAFDYADELNEEI